MKSRALTVLALTILLSACQPQPTKSSGDMAALSDTLTHLIADAYDFSKPGVVERMSALYPDTGSVISASAGHITASADSLRIGIESFWNNVGHNMRNPKWVWDKVYVERLDENAAVLTGTWSIPHIAPNNQPHVIEGAWTAVFRRINGQWKIVQEHLSVPAR